MRVRVRLEKSARHQEGIATTVQRALDVQRVASSASELELPGVSSQLADGVHGMAKLMDYVKNELAVIGGQSRQPAPR